MPQFCASAHLPASARLLFDWHKRPGAFERMTPYWVNLKILESQGGIFPGGRVSIKTGPLGLSRWSLLHTDYQEGAYFTDELLSGPFKRWRHQHLFTENGHDETHLTEQIDYILPWYFKSFNAYLQSELQRYFSARMDRLKRELSFPGLELDAHPLTIAVTGSRGLVGSALCPLLTLKGHRVRQLISRGVGDASSSYSYNPLTGEGLSRALEGCDAIIHLAGESIAAYWSPSKKQSIWESRIKGTENLVLAIKKLKKPPSSFIMASAIGYYNSPNECIADEEQAKGVGFLSDLSHEWEKKADDLKSLGIRVCHLRLGTVLSPRGGLLKVLLPFFKARLGFIWGFKEHSFPWVSIDDVVLAFYKALNESGFHGPINLVSPSSISQRFFANTLAKVLGINPGISHSCPLIPWIGGEMFRETLGQNVKVIPARLKAMGFPFRYAEIENALMGLLGIYPFGS